MTKIVKAFYTAVFLVSCTGKAGESSVSASEQVKLEQYLVEGRTLYLQHCSACHQADGKGLARLYPPLSQSDYLEGKVEKVVCYIRNGLNGPITVNGIEYNQAMPANYNLTPLEIAEITTYVYNSWGRSDGLISVLEVEKYLKNCSKD